MTRSFRIATVVLCLAGFSCREVCDSDEVRYGDKCAKVPDSGTLSSEDASRTTDEISGSSTDAGEEGAPEEAGAETTARDAGEEATLDAAAAQGEDSGSSEGLCEDSTGTHECVCASDARPDGAPGCHPESACEPNPCLHGTCTEVLKGYACACDDGYAAPNASTPCANVNECANSSLCKPDFPCRDLDPFYTCNGHMADWRMPGSSPGGVPVTASYTDNGDGTVRDEVTGLTWQKDDPGDTYDWENAKRYCADLALGGSSDWRLPSKIELESIINFTRTQPPAIDPIFSNTFSGAYWTSTSQAPTWPYSVNFLVGLTDPGWQGSSLRQHARCVRDGVLQLPVARRYVTTSETVADTRTGLVWERYPPSERDDWFNHHSRCGSLSLEGDLDDWRLPTVKELLTIVDTTQRGGSADLIVVPPSAGPLWTATRISGTNAYFVAYLVPGHTDGFEQSAKSLSSICVR